MKRNSFFSNFSNLISGSKNDESKQTAYSFLTPSGHNSALESLRLQNYDNIYTETFMKPNEKQPNQVV